MTVKVMDAAGVAVYEMPVQGTVGDAAVRALAAEAMCAAAATVTSGVAMGDLSGDLHAPVGAGTLRAEAIVMRRGGATMRVAADVLSGDLRVASFEAEALIAA